MWRRNILKAVGSGSIGIGSLSAKSVNTAAEEDDVTAQGHDESARAALVKQTQSDPDVRKLIRKITARGWHLSWDDAKSKRVINKNEGGQYDYVVVTGEPINRQVERSEQLILIWFGNDTIGLDIPYHTVVHHVKKTSEPSSSGLLGWNEITVMKPERGGVVKTKRNFDENPIEPNDYYLPDPGDGGDTGCCTVEVQVADDAKWDCVAQAIAGSISGSVPCTACLVDLTRASCGVCVFVAIVNAVTTIHCFNDKGPVIEADVEKWFFEEHEDFDCHDFMSFSDDEMVVSETFYNNELPLC